MSALALALESMSPEARAVLAEELETIVRLLRTPPTTPARRPRAKHVPQLAPRKIDPGRAARLEAELARRGIG